MKFEHSNTELNWTREQCGQCFAIQSQFLVCFAWQLRHVCLLLRTPTHTLPAQQECLPSRIAIWNLKHFLKGNKQGEEEDFALISTKFRMCDWTRHESKLARDARKGPMFCHIKLTRTQAHAQEPLESHFQLGIYWKTGHETWLTPGTREEEVLK